MNAILFTGGAIENTVPTTSLNLSHLKRGLFGSKNEDEKTPRPIGPRYSEKVLLGNWFEERVVENPTPDDWITIYRTHYKPHDAKDRTEDMFTIWKNKVKTQGTDRQPVIDGDVYLNNMTSSYDLSYRILPKNLCGPRIRVFNQRKNLWVPENELAMSFGNQTGYGLIEAVKEEQRLAELIPPWESVYQVDYNESVVTAQDLFGKR